MIDAAQKPAIYIHMKRLLLALTLTAFAVATTQADEAKPAKGAKDAPCCSANSKQQVKATKATGAECSGCCKEKQQVKLMSPKAAAEMGR
jgi:hypothetical protein